MVVRLSPRLDDTDAGDAKTGGRRGGRVVVGVDLVVVVVGWFKGCEGEYLRPLPGSDDVNRRWQRCATAKGAGGTTSRDRHPWRLLLNYTSGEGINS